jgi:hypothetical protein
VTGGNDAYVGGLIGNQQTGTISRCHASGAVTAGIEQSMAGGLVGFGGGYTINDSYATGVVKGGFEVGGLVGDHTYGMLIRQSYATGAVTSTASNAFVGGLVGFNEGPLSDTYAVGAVSGDGAVGGLVGDNDDTIATSYATGAVTGSGFLGGLVGYDFSVSGDLTHTYWDTTTSGITDLSQGAGNIANDSGIKGKTTSQLKAGLPNGFSSSVWGESPSISGGLPYLLAVPPP